MERDKLLAALRELSDRGHGAAGFKPLYVIEQEILAEFDRLTQRVAELEGKLWDAQDEQPEGLNKEKLPLEVYHRFEWFWYEPEVTEILDDLYSGESEAVSKLTDRILALNGEGWRVAIITKPNPEPQQPEGSE